MSILNPELHIQQLERSVTERFQTLQAQLFQLQGHHTETVIVFDRERQATAEKIAALTRRIEALEKAPQERQEQFQKLWDWVKKLEQRIIRTERGEQVTPGTPT